MKFAFSLTLLSALVLMSQQNALPHFRNVLPPLSGFAQQPSVHDIYDYLQARNLVESLKLANQGPQLNNQPQWADIQSRSQSGQIIEAGNPGEEAQSNARLFFNYVTTVGGSSTYYNPLLKTVYYVSSAFATSTSVITCVPAASFDKTSYTIACRKRREVLEMIKVLHDEPMLDVQDFSPSEVVPLEATAAAPLPRSLGDDAILIPADISSSKTDEYLVEKGIFSDVEQVREKRLFIASSTITSYIFITTTSTKTLSKIAAAAVLSCLPTQFALC